MALTYDDLLSLHRTEKSTNALANLPEGFDSSLAKLLVDVKAKAAIEPNGIKMLENARRAAIALISLRRQKILLRAIANEGKIEGANERENKFFTQVRHICTEEDEWIDRIAAAVYGYGKREGEGGWGEATNAGKAGWEEKENNAPKNDNEAKPLKKLRILKDIADAYRGADGESYGPFKAGQSVELPQNEACWIVNKGMGIEESNNGQIK